VDSGGEKEPGYVALAEWFERYAQDPGKWLGPPELPISA
jgi:hypothetical protein